MARRTYKRDSNGRFASSGSTGRQRPASRPAPRGRNRLTRDNSGRITGTGDGATARGGRLRTGAGNLRATQTARLKGQGGKVRRPVGGGGVKVAKAGGGASVVAAKPVRVRGNFRPQGVMAKPGKQENPFGSKDRAMTKNAETARKWMASKTTVPVNTYREGARKYRGQSIARVVTSTGGATWDRSTMQVQKTGLRQEIQVNQLSKYWKNPQRRSRELRGSGFLSTSAPVGPLWHELGHTKDARLKRDYGWKGGVDSWYSNYGLQGAAKKRIASRVSKYATTHPAEFLAETYAGRRTGRRYDSQVMRAYREARDLPGIRTGSRVAPGGAALASPSAVARDRARRRRKPKP